MVYEDILDINSLKKMMGEKLEDYNETPGMIHMDLVLFRDAIEHSKLCFISCLFSDKQCITGIA